MNKFGPHFQRYTNEMALLIAEWQPPLVVWVDPNQEGIAEIRRVSPNTFIMGRKDEEGHNWRPFAYDYQTSPEWWADECAAMGRCDAYLYNEPIGHDEKHLFAAFDEWQMRFRARLLEHGVECVGLNVGTGNFTKLDDIAGCFPRTCATFKHLGIHEYDWIIDPAKRPIDVERLGYYWNRWPYWLECIGRDDVTLWITECGMTQAVHAGRPDKGWRSGADGMTDDDYIRWADWYNRQIVQDERVGAAALFNFSGYGWETFEHLDWVRLDEILALDAEPPEIGGKTTMFPRVLNIDGTELTGEAAEDLVRYHGLTLTYPILQDGDKFLDLVKLEEREGPACFIFTVLKEDGTPWAGMETAWGWKGMDEEANDIETPYATDWHARADIGLANENGNNGPGFGQSGWWHDPYQAGPGRAWIRHEQYWSVLIEGIGMEGGTNHRTMYGTWQLKTYKGEEPPPTGDLAAEVDAIADRLKEIAPLIRAGGSVTKLVAHYEDGSETTFVKETTGGLVAKVWALVGR